MSSYCNFVEGFVTQFIKKLSSICLIAWCSIFIFDLGCTEWPYQYPVKYFCLFYPTVSLTSKCSLSSPFLHNNNLQLSSFSGGTFRSPSYPLYYPNNMVCTWKITAPSGKRLKLSFTYFRLESGVCSTNDYLEVRDGSTSTSVRKGTYCGTYAPTITSSGRYLWVRFRSDSSLSFKGFEARYTVFSADCKYSWHKLRLVIVTYIVI